MWQGHAHAPSEKLISIGLWDDYNSNTIWALKKKILEQNLYNKSLFARHFVMETDKSNPYESVY